VQEQDRIPFAGIDVVHPGAVNVDELRFEREGRGNFVGASRNSFCFHDIASYRCYALDSSDTQIP
jgi:hypothetical protein